MERYERSLCHGTVVPGMSNKKKVVSQGDAEIG